MLYYFSSVEYLQLLHKMVSDIIDNVADPALSVAKHQERDKNLINKRWGKRDTSENWSNNAWPFLKDLQRSLAQDIAMRPNGDYRKTSVNDCLRGIAEYSTDWMTPREEQKLKNTMAVISDYALPHDHTLDSYQNWWDDYEFSAYYKNFASKNALIPKFRVRHDIFAATGEVPPRTGVYLAHNDPHATLQFIWTERGGACLRAAKTFNDIGLAALDEVGRKDLWFDEAKMFNFAMSEKYASLFQSLLKAGDQYWASTAPAVVATKAFESAARTWSLVEIIPNEQEPLDTLDLDCIFHEYTAQQARGGTFCQVEGFYFTPSQAQSRRLFRKGDLLPNIDNTFGETHWQWDINQQREA